MLKKFRSHLSFFNVRDTSDSYPKLPRADKKGRSNIPGIYLSGALVGSDLIKHCILNGRRVADTVIQDLDVAVTTDQKADYDVIVIGGGVSGLSAAGKFLDSSLRIMVLESGEIAQNLKNFTRGKKILAEPESVTIKEGPDFKEGSIESVVSTFIKYTEQKEIPYREHEKVTDIIREDNYFKVVTGDKNYTAHKILLSFGKTGNPRKTGVPGERNHSQWISHHLTDPSIYKDKKVVIYGGGDVAAEAALSLSEVAFETTIVYRGHSFQRPQKKNRDRLYKKINSGGIRAFTDSQLKKIGSHDVEIQDGAGNKTSLEYDHLFEMVGSELPVRLLSKIGIKLANEWDIKKWITLFMTFAVVYVLYAWKKGFFPFTQYAAGLSGFHGIFKNPSFWYSLLYTVLMVFFGTRAALRWRKGQNGRHQVWRFSSLIFFQLLSFFIIECLFALFLPGDVWWRAYAINNPFPLLFDSFYNMSGVSPGELKWMIVALGFLMTFVVIPLFVRRHGKRFCTWVCGCGGLAETLGDTWRHLSPKGKLSRRFEAAGGVILFWAVISSLIILFYYNGNTGDSGLWHSSYALIVDFWLVAVIPVSVYPVFGGKIWCRFFCPLAKYMQVLSSRYGRLSIESKDKCIKCTDCSTYCQVGVDVMAFAKNEQSFSNRETSCIHCGICINVCPVDNLAFGLIDVKSNKGKI